MRRRKFKDQGQQATYDGLLDMPQDRIGKEVLSRGGSAQVAFTLGYTGGEMTGYHRYLKTSTAYAAYCAGKDRLALEQEGKP